MLRHNHAIQIKQTVARRHMLKGEQTLDLCKVVQSIDATALRLQSRHPGNMILRSAATTQMRDEARGCWATQSLMHRSRQGFCATAMDIPLHIAMAARLLPWKTHSCERRPSLLSRQPTGRSLWHISSHCAESHIYYISAYALEMLE